MEINTGGNVKKIEKVVKWQQIPWPNKYDDFYLKVELHKKALLKTNIGLKETEFENF